MEFIEFGVSRGDQVRDIEIIAIKLILEIICYSILLNLFVFSLFSGGNLLKCIKLENLKKALVLMLTTLLEGNFMGYAKALYTLVNTQFSGIKQNRSIVRMLSKL